MPVGWNVFQVSSQVCSRFCIPSNPIIPNPKWASENFLKLPETDLLQCELLSRKQFCGLTPWQSQPRLCRPTPTPPLPESPQQSWHSEVPFHPPEPWSHPHPVLAVAPSSPDPSSLKCWENPLQNYQGSGQLWRAGGYLYGFCWAEPKSKKGRDLLFQPPGGEKKRKWPEITEREILNR